MNTYEQRFTEILELICKESPPTEMITAWISGDSDELQDWVGSTSCPWWLQNIGAIDAAVAAAREPIEGEILLICYDRPV